MYEDTVAELRKTELVTVMTSVVVSAPVLEELYSKALSADSGSHGRLDLVSLLNLVRAHPQNTGWLIRWTTSLRTWCGEWVDAVTHLSIAWLPFFVTDYNSAIPFTKRNYRVTHKI